ncbi:hypothetical protein NIES1031_10155 [Chroogloeocystis siderophila 5.2 s.c.1]|uniref:Uncharacterized protein n=1 Tax=Chroogloeocystis siderophila 5.2 s.c.1 TaxID=247279 RepID=A0A1U7HTZ5_9CHRO|nr:hypothetical protein NIES1031_10155 [Chroogloeocystis siderophila 5.2 s.c.1]
MGNLVIKELNDTIQGLVEPIALSFVRDVQASTFYKPIPPAFLDTAVSESLKVSTTNGMETSFSRANCRKSRRAVKPN